MKKNKLFSKYFFIILIIFVSFNFIIWNINTKYIFDSDKKVGDLGRMSYSLDDLFPRKNVNNLKRKHIDINDYYDEDIDLITIGDSFLNGAAGGENSYIQDFIATMHNLRVLNIPSLKGYTYLETIAILNSSGFLEDKSVKYVLIESVQRNLVTRFSTKTNTDLNYSSSNLLNELKQVKISFEHNNLRINMINNLNFNAFLYNILYKFDDNAFFSQCYKVDLSQNLFSSISSNKLLFYNKDIRRIELETSENIRKMNINLNNLSKDLKKKNIKLFFMPAVDKYNLYSSFITNNKYPKSNLFEELRVLDKDYYFVDTKDILLKEIKKGEKDIYYSDDTHWSNKASEIIVKNMNFKEKRNE